MQTVHVDTVSGASTILYTFTVDRGVSWEVTFILKPLSVSPKNLCDMKCIYISVLFYITFFSRNAGELCIIL